MQSRILLVTPRIAICFCSASEMKYQQQSPMDVRRMHFVDFLVERQVQDVFSPASVQQISGFSLLMHRLLRGHPGKTIVICTPRNTSPESITLVSLFVGGFMILGQNSEVGQVLSSFESLCQHFVGFCDPGNRTQPRPLTVEDCWRALHRARCHDWINLSQELRPNTDPQYRGTFDIEECEHYNMQLNGKMCMVVPGKLVVFQRPVDLPATYHWADTQAGRYFSPSFYAAAFRDVFDVAIVLRLGQSGENSYDWGTFVDEGIEVEDLHVDPTGRGLLGAVDRFLTIAQAVPAPTMVALHNRADDAGYTGSLAVAYLTRLLNFDAKAAIAWIRMVQPELLIKEADGNLGSSVLPIAELRTSSCGASLQGGGASDNIVVERTYSLPSNYEAGIPLEPQADGFGFQPSQAIST